MTAQEGLALALTIVFSLTLLAMFVAGFGLILSKIGGWGKLANHYRARKAFPKPGWWFQSAGMGVVRYNFIIKAAAAADGIYIVPMFPLRLSHAPLFIPWDDIEIEPGTNFLSAWEYRFAKDKQIKFKVGNTLHERLIGARQA